MVKRIFYSLLILCCITNEVAGQTDDKWIIIKGKVVDTFGYSMDNARIALISQNGTDKRIKHTDSFGQFFFKLKKKNIDKYALRCYFFGDLNSNKLLSVKEFIKTDKYLVGSNVFYFTHWKNNFTSPYLRQIIIHCPSVSVCDYGINADEKYWRNIPVDQTSPTEILKSQYSFLK